mmetsp:Transcript_60896/g.130919  ORF Transcript_60896/g.130919 Transcript_60896/m.130919 type:complete len:234 (-) Transcript_60896:419-1120(-)
MRTLASPWAAPSGRCSTTTPRRPSRMMTNASFRISSTLSSPTAATTVTVSCRRTPVPSTCRPCAPWFRRRPRSGNSGQTTSAAPLLLWARRARCSPHLGLWRSRLPRRAHPREASCIRVPTTRQRRMCLSTCSPAPCPSSTRRPRMRSGSVSTSLAPSKCAPCRSRRERNSSAQSSRSGIRPRRASHRFSPPRATRRSSRLQSTSRRPTMAARLLRRRCTAATTSCSRLSRRI